MNVLDFPKLDQNYRLESLMFIITPYLAQN